MRGSKKVSNATSSETKLDTWSVFSDATWTATCKAVSLATSIEISNETWSATKNATRDTTNRPTFDALMEWVNEST